ncbi:hypothetical protein T11_10142 [Trichinella zimbabwensis]|uniref:Uncharacterized protein n=2 Tax=Trichinella TaxID=6333 RepID=A0A0V1MKG3_9BILA|nr:hypothetical protein T11_10142 [Trichinella zimbabwensis]KRZ72015.1 hypothetical protein T10_12277 [Trichinella papuae]
MEVFWYAFQSREILSASTCRSAAGPSSLPSVVGMSIIYHIAVSWTAAGDEQPHCCEQRQYPSYQAASCCRSD